VFRDEQRTLLRIPDRVGDEKTYWDEHATTLEELAGETWSGDVLAQLLRRERTWAWWTQTRVFDRTGLASEKAPADIDVTQLRSVQRRNLFWKNMTLVVIPPRETNAQDVVCKWAGLDTEQVPDAIWTAPDGLVTWDTERIVAWCQEKEAWSDPRSLSEQPAETILLLHDADIFCAMPSNMADAAWAALVALAERWGISVTTASPDFAWVRSAR
jgi:hypothetical protein